MVKFRELVNPVILNAGWVNFNGDSEFIDANGEYQLGNWSFLDIIDDEDSRTRDNFVLDDEIDEEEVYDSTPWAVENDKGQLCIIQINYRRDEK